MGFQARQVERNHHPNRCAQKMGGNDSLLRTTARRTLAGSGDLPGVQTTARHASTANKARGTAVRVIAAVLYLFGPREPCKYCPLLEETGREFPDPRFDKQRRLHHGRMLSLAIYGQPRASRPCR
jgi:hypothetical protein